MEGVPSIYPFCGKGQFWMELIAPLLRSAAIYSIQKLPF
jgi:hypothetical protein